MEGPFTVEKQDFGIYVKFKAGLEVTSELIIDALDTENDKYDIKGRYDLWDFRGCRPSSDFGYNAVLRVIEHIECKYNVDWSIKTGILVDETIQFGLSRMFQLLVDGYPTQVGVFQDENEAYQWVNRRIDQEGDAQ